MAKLVAKGIDVSSYQGDVDFEKVKAAGYSFVIIKAGQGLRQMATFRGKYLPAVQSAGLDWGAYWWSDAVTVEEARQEAQAFVQALRGLRPTYPVWMDQEYGSPCGTAWGVGKGKQLRTDMAKAFLEVLQDAGYYAGLYASKDWLENWVYSSQLAAYDKWVAQYAGACTYAGAYGIWQRSGSGKVDGIAAAVDLNECYKDYPSVIKGAGLNGWGNPAAKPDEPEEETDYQALYEDAQARYTGLVEDLQALMERWGSGWNG